MVEMAGSAGAGGQAVGTLLDPCCGAGAILAEALAAGWAAEGTDIDAAAIEVAARNAPGARVQLGDARDLLLPDDYAGACVSRLPSGRQALGGWQDWAAAVLAEMSRVTRSGGSVVLLAPQVPRSAIPAALRLRRQVPVRVLGTAATIWVFRRA
jgi:tRNA G10  N-methylase Trm11